jgi:hypothetical protein
MPLRERDLENTVLKKISIDEFEPKTGNEKDVAVVGFYVNSEEAGTDLYNFMSHSVIENRDVELSPNADEDGYFMVFVEVDRNEELLKNITTIAEEVERVAGKLNWQFKTPYLQEYTAFSDAEKYVQQDSEDYLTAADYKAKLEGEFNKVNDDEPEEEEEGVPLIPKEESAVKTEDIMEFLHNTNLLDASVNEGILTIKDARGKLDLQIVDFGYGPDVMSELGIQESAIKADPDKFLFDKLSSMLGEMKALPIDNYVVVYDPSHKDVLIAKSC